MTDEEIQALWDKSLAERDYLTAYLCQRAMEDEVDRGNPYKSLTKAEARSRLPVVR